MRWTARARRPRASHGALASSTYGDHIMPYGPTKFVNGQNDGAQPANTQILKATCRSHLSGRVRLGEGGLPDPAGRLKQAISRAGPCCSGLLLPAVLNGLTLGAVYALIALGLTLIYGVLHIINFAHGSLLMLALYAAFFLYTLGGVDPYVAVFVLMPAFFALGYVLAALCHQPAWHGRDENILLVTLGLAIVIDNRAALALDVDTRTIDTPYAFEVVDLGVAFIPLPKVIGFFGALAFGAAALGADAPAPISARQSGRWRARGRRAACRHRVDHIYAMTFGIGTAMVARRGLSAVADLLRHAAGRQCLRAGRFHHRRAGRHGQFRRRALRGPPARRC